MALALWIQPVKRIREVGVWTRRSLSSMSIIRSFVIVTVERTRRLSRCVFFFFSSRNSGEIWSSLLQDCSEAISEFESQRKSSTFSICAQNGTFFQIAMVRIETLGQ
jgi:hypothetical protein